MDPLNGISSPPDSRVAMPDTEPWPDEISELPPIPTTPYGTGITLRGSRVYFSSEYVRDEGRIHTPADDVLDGCASMACAIVSEVILNPQPTVEVDGLLRGKTGVSSPRRLYDAAGAENV